MNIITIDADKAAEEIQSHMEDIYICDDVTLKPIKAILEGCAVPMPESVEKVAKEIIDTICSENKEPMYNVKSIALLKIRLCTFYMAQDLRNDSSD